MKLFESRAASGGGRLPEFPLLSWDGPPAPSWVAASLPQAVAMLYFYFHYLTVSNIHTKWSACSTA